MCVCAYISVSMIMKREEKNEDRLRKMNIKMRMERKRENYEKIKFYVIISLSTLIIILL